MSFMQELDPWRILALLIAFLVAVTVHEFMHAWTAWRLGDDTARLLGRISLNPAVHFDPIGFLLFIGIVLGAPLLAWGKPVPVNLYALRPLGPLGRKGSMALVAFAGPLSNVVMALVAVLPLRAVRQTGVDLGPEMVDFLKVFLSLNLSLAAFNMIPIPPLDGSKILTGILPNFWYPILVPLERYGFAILLILIFLPMGGIVLGAMIRPVIIVLTQLIVFTIGVDPRTVRF